MFHRDSVSYMDFEGLVLADFRRTIWAIMENPAASPIQWKLRIARVFAAISVSLISVSVITLIFGSMHEFQNEKREPINALGNSNTVNLCV